MEELPDFFFQRFSVVDLFSYLIPGAVWIFYSCYIMNITPDTSLFAFVDVFFLKHWAVRLIFFLCLSYVAGMILSESSYWLWRTLRCLWGALIKFAKKFCGQRNDNSSDGQQGDRSAPREWVQRLPKSELIRKQQLYQGYYEFSRTMSAAALIMLLEWLPYARRPKNKGEWILGLALILALVLLVVRGRRFYKYREEYRDALKNP